MKKGDIYYLIYLILLMGITFYTSSFLLTTSFTGKYVLVEPVINTTSCISFTSNGRLLYLWIPNCEVIENGTVVSIKPFKIKINSDGFRDREFSIVKPNNTIRIIALGDSFTYGYGVEVNESWPKLLEKTLNISLTNFSVEVLNMGVPGYNIFEQIEFFRMKGLKYDPDIVIFTFQSNDIINSSNVNEKYEELKELLQNKKLEVPKNVSTEGFLFKLSYDLCYSETFNHSFKKAWKELIEEPIEKLVILSKKRNFKIFLVIFFYNSKEMKELQKLIKRFNIPYLDLQEEMYSKYPTNLLQIHPLDPHPSPYANRLIANLIKDKLFSDNLLSIEN